MRLKDKIAIVVGAGQTPGDTIGNGRATAILFAREGAKLMLVDRDINSAEETKRMIDKEGGQSFTFRADVVSENDCKAMAEECKKRYGRIDVLVNVVGIGSGDAGPTSIKEEIWDRIINVNLKSALLPCKYCVPIMREQQSGSVINISSIASITTGSNIAYKTSKAGLNAYTQSLAIGNAKYGIRANVIMPGLMDTPMAIESISKARGETKEALRKRRSASVPLKGGMGSGWDVAYAALFLASDEAKFITGILLPVDGGQSTRRG